MPKFENCTKLIPKILFVYLNCDKQTRNEVNLFISYFYYQINNSPMLMWINNEILTKSNPLKILLSLV